MTKIINAVRQVHYPLDIIKFILIVAPNRNCTIIEEEGLSGVDILGNRNNVKISIT